MDQMYHNLMQRRHLRQTPTYRIIVIGPAKPRVKIETLITQSSMKKKLTTILANKRKIQITTNIQNNIIIINCLVLGLRLFQQSGHM